MSYSSGWSCFTRPRRALFEANLHALGREFVVEYPPNLADEAVAVLLFDFDGQPATQVAGSGRSADMGGTSPPER